MASKLALDQFFVAVRAHATRTSPGWSGVSRRRWCSSNSSLAAATPRSVPTSAPLIPLPMPNAASTTTPQGADARYGDCEEQEAAKEPEDGAHADTQHDVFGHVSLLVVFEHDRVGMADRDPRCSLPNPTLRSTSTAGLGGCAISEDRRDVVVGDVAGFVRRRRDDPGEMPQDLASSADADGPYGAVKVPSGSPSRVDTATSTASSSGSETPSNRMISTASSVAGSWSAPVLTEHSREPEATRSSSKPTARETGLRFGKGFECHHPIVHPSRHAVEANAPPRSVPGVDAHPGIAQEFRWPGAMGASIGKRRSGPGR